MEPKPETIKKVDREEFSIDDEIQNLLDKNNDQIVALKKIIEVFGPEGGDEGAGE